MYRLDPRPMPLIDNTAVLHRALGLTDTAYLAFIARATRPIRCRTSTLRAVVAAQGPSPWPSSRACWPPTGATSARSADGRAPARAAGRPGVLHRQGGPARAVGEDGHRTAHRGGPARPARAPLHRVAPRPAGAAAGRSGTAVRSTSSASSARAPTCSCAASTSRGRGAQRERPAGVPPVPAPLGRRSRTDDPCQPACHRSRQTAVRVAPRGPALDLPGVPAGRALWVFREPQAGPLRGLEVPGRQPQALRAIAAGEGTSIWQGQRLPAESVELVRASTLLDDPGVGRGAVLGGANRLFFDLGLDDRDDVLAVDYDLRRRPGGPDAPTLRVHRPAYRPQLRGTSCGRPGRSRSPSMGGDGLAAELHEQAPCGGRSALGRASARRHDARAEGTRSPWAPSPWPRSRWRSRHGVQRRDRRAGSRAFGDRCRRPTRAPGGAQSSSGSTGGATGSPTKPATSAPAALGAKWDWGRYRVRAVPEGDVGADLLRGDVVRRRGEPGRSRLEHAGPHRRPQPEGRRDDDAEAASRQVLGDRR